MNNLIPFKDRLRQILYDKNITIYKLVKDTSISTRIFYDRGRKHKISKSMLMALAYYLDMKVEDLVEGTTAMDSWYV